MAGIPKRATGVEKTLVGSLISDRENWRHAAEAIGADFKPLTDLRASSSYRLQVAKNLVLKALAEIEGRAGDTLRIQGRGEMRRVTR